MKLMKKKKGFTLVELMAVIAIIAILAAVLVPTVTGYINRAKKTAFVTQVRNVVSAVEAYNAGTSSIIANIDTIGSISTSTRDTTPVAKSNVAQNLYDAELISATKDIDLILNTLSVGQLKQINGDEAILNNLEYNKTTKVFEYQFEADTALDVDVSAEAIPVSNKVN